MRQVAGCALLGLALAALGGCGGGEKKSEEEAPNSAATAACTGSALTGSPRLPAGFPQVEHVTYTKQRTLGPTDVVEGYFEGDLKDA
ncbi:MAG TPA: hypothetical protein VGJ27_13065 [Gaiellaceae bacterium]|jgi:hypothetical protein